jgi:Ca-activated chloride channel family protein
MTFQQPAGLWLLALIPAILLIHLFRATPRRQSVPGVFLWYDLNRDLTASRRWRPPRLSWLLFLQLFAVGVVSLAVAMPRITAPPRKHLFVLLDASASMLATDVAPSRFGEAARRAGGLLAGLEPQDRATLIRVGPSPRILAADVDPGAAQAALAGLQAGAGSAAMREALFMASGLAGRTADATVEAVVLTDGAVADPGELSALSLPVRFETVGRSAQNQAVAELQVAREPRQSGGLSAFARLVNYADQPLRVPVRLLADGVVQETRQIDLPARSRAEVSFGVPAGARRVAVALDGQDALPADNLAEVALQAGVARRALLVSRLPDTLQRALGSIPDLEVETVSPESYAGASADLVVFDGVLPERLPPGHLLIVNPPAGRPYLPVGGETRTVQVTGFDSRHPLLESVDLSAARLTRVAAVTPPPWARVVAEGGGLPLLLEGRESGRSIVVMPFDASASGIDKMIAFPLLVSNAVSFLTGGELGPSLDPGVSTTVPVGLDVRDVQLEGPDRTVRQLPVEAGAVVLDRLDLPGRYTLRERGGSAREPRVFSINVADEAESAIAPRQLAAASSATRIQEQLSVTATELWPLLLMLGLVVFGAEWWRFGRRG